MFIEKTYNELIFMTSPNIQAVHAFTTRFGGVSGGIYESLNLAFRVDDVPGNVKENYSRLCRALGILPKDIVCSNQVHGTFIRVVTNEDCGRLFTPNEHQADGLISATPGVALMVFTADCVPILLHDPVRNVAGAVHAGWRSTVSNIAGMAVQKMESEFGSSPADIRAAIGPCISRCCYETDADVADAMHSILPTSNVCTQKQNGKYTVDLKEANRLLLAQAGLLSIEVSDECTSCKNDKYWSHRKTNGKRGTQATVIIIKD